MQVFEVIRSAKPPRLYIASDGARLSVKEEAEKVAVVRDYILKNIDWDCEIKTLFRDENLGCKYAVSGAITWFFKNEKQGIILEDDCLPSLSFFWYCEELLGKYENNNEVFLISGDARGPESFEMEEDYALCKYPLIWGWASWSRVWQKYDVEMQDWPKISKVLPPSISKNKPTVRFWKNTFQKVYNNEINTWDFQLAFLVLKNKGKCIVPRVNLITNIGFGANATHTFDEGSSSANRPRYEINIPLTHSLKLDSENKINNYYDNNEFLSRSFFERVLGKLFRVFCGMFKCRL